MPSVKTSNLKKKTKKKKTKKKKREIKESGLIQSSDFCSVNEYNEWIFNHASFAYLNITFLKICNTKKVSNA